MQKQLPLPLAEELLHRIEDDFYHNLPKRRFYRDRPFLLYVISWPAAWLHHRALTMPKARYRQIILQRLDQIKAHSDFSKAIAFFPAYLLKCLQNYFLHQGDQLYDELKHIRNSIDSLFDKLDKAQPEDPQHLVPTLAHLNRLMRSPYKTRKKLSPHQLTLF